MAEISDILTKLLERTDEDKVSWQPTADESTFTAVLGKSSVMIDQDYRLGFVLTILNAEGREIERVNSSEVYEVELEPLLQELYYKAKRIALRVESELDELLKELEAGV